MCLYVRAQAGDPDALSALMRRHMPLVQTLSRRFAYNEDAFQQGCVGLLTAIRRFREDMGVQFSTYAVPVILGEMRKTAKSSIGWRARAALRKARKYQERVYQTSGREPGVRETADAAGVRPEELALLLEWDQPPVPDQSGDLLVSLPDPAGEAWLTRLLIRDILERMERRDAWILTARFWQGCSQTALAKQMELPQYTLSRLEKRARLRFAAAWNE